MIPRLFGELDYGTSDTDVIVIWAVAEPTEVPLFMALLNTAATKFVMSGDDPKIRTEAKKNPLFF